MIPRPHLIGRAMLATHKLSRLPRREPALLYDSEFFQRASSRLVVARRRPNI